MLEFELNQNILSIKYNKDVKDFNLHKIVQYCFKEDQHLISITHLEESPIQYSFISEKAFSIFCILQEFISSEHDPLGVPFIQEAKMDIKLVSQPSTYFTDFGGESTAIHDSSAVAVVESVVSVDQPISSIMDTTKNRTGTLKRMKSFFTNLSANTEQKSNDKSLLKRFKSVGSLKFPRRFSLSTKPEISNDKDNEIKSCNFPSSGSLELLLFHLANSESPDFAEILCFTIQDIIPLKSLLCKIKDYILILLENNAESLKLNLERLLGFVITLSKTFPESFIKPVVYNIAVDLISQLKSICDVELHNQYLESITKIPLSPIQLPNHEESIDFLDINNETIAKQMTLIDFAIFHSIKPNEFASFGNDGLDTLDAINISKLISRTTEISTWASSLVLNASSIRNSVLIFEKLIKIAKKCLDFKNFNTCMAIITGISHPKIEILNQLSSETLIQLKLLEAFFDPKDNYGMYRFSLAKTPRGCVPVMMLICKDIMLTKKLHSSHLPGGQINVERLVSLHGIIKPLITIQSFRYNFKNLYCPIKAKSPTDLASYLTKLVASDSSASNNVPLSRTVSELTLKAINEDEDEYSITLGGSFELETLEALELL